MMKVLSITLLFFLLVLQSQIWFGKSGVTSLNSLQTQLEEQRLENEQLQARNQQLRVEILDLKNGLEAVEERARTELGMIGENETYYMIIK